MAVDFSEAKQRAIKNALDDVGLVYNGPPEGAIDPEFLEAEHCWMFFQHRSIELPPEQSLRKFAYVFGKQGGGRCVPDYRSDRVALADYLEKISEYFSKNHH